MHRLTKLLASIDLVLVGFCFSGVCEHRALARAADAADAPASWFLIFRNGDHRKAVSDDGKTVIELKDDPRLKYDRVTLRRLQILNQDSPTGAVLSSDGQQMAYIGAVNDGRAVPHPFHGQVCLCRPDGTEAKTLVKTTANRAHLSWSPDGTRLAFDEEMQHNAGALAPPRGMRQVHFVDSTTGVVRRTFAGTTSVSRPSFTPKGNLLYHSYRGRDGKRTLDDVHFATLGGTPEDEARLSRTLVERKYVLGSALSPDETQFAYAVPGAMCVKSLDGKTERRWTVEEVGKQIGIEWFIVFAGPVWRPDGRAVASRCAFIGGRQNGDDTPVKGEEKIVIFPLDGELKAFDFAPRWTIERWMQSAEAERLRK